MFRANSDESYKMSASKSNKKDKDLEQRISKWRKDKIMWLFFESCSKCYFWTSVSRAGRMKHLQSHLISTYLFVFWNYVFFHQNRQLRLNGTILAIMESYIFNWFWFIIMWILTYLKFYWSRWKSKCDFVTNCGLWLQGSVVENQELTQNFIKYMHDIVLEISFLDINSQNWITGSCLKFWQKVWIYSTRVNKHQIFLDVVDRHEKSDFSC